MPIPAQNGSLAYNHCTSKQATQATQQHMLCCFGFLLFCTSKCSSSFLLHDAGHTKSWSNHKTGFTAWGALAQKLPTHSSVQFLWMRSGHGKAPKHVEGYALTDVACYLCYTTAILATDCSSRIACVIDTFHSQSGTMKYWIDAPAGDIKSTSEGTRQRAFARAAQGISKAVAKGISKIPSSA